MNSYQLLKDKHQKEFSAFPMKFAFSQEQFNQGMTELGLKPTDTDKVYGFGGTGGFYRKEDSPRLKEMFERHEKERKEAIAKDTTGEGYIFEMFNYELANHEYCITGEVTDSLDALGLSVEEINANPLLQKGLKLAVSEQYKNM